MNETNKFDKYDMVDDYSEADFDAAWESGEPVAVGKAARLSDATFDISNPQFSHPLFVQLKTDVRISGAQTINKDQVTTAV